MTQGDAIPPGWFYKNIKTYLHLVSIQWKLCAEAGDVAHILLHVRTVLLLTSDLTNCWIHRKSTWQTHQLVLLLLSPCTPLALQPITLLYEKMPGLQKHLKDRRCFTVLLLCNFSVIILLLFSFPRFWGSVWWWWHPVNNVTPRHTSTFFFFLVESKPTIFWLMTYNFLS